MGPQEESISKNGIRIIDRLNIVTLLPECGDISGNPPCRHHGEYSHGDIRDTVPRFLPDDEPDLQADAGKKVVVCEGTGQPGVGSVVGLSNGDVIKLLKEMGVTVITLLVARGGIGSTIDRIFPQLLLILFLQKHS